jgi:hypothetical protein
LSVLLAVFMLTGSAWLFTHLAELAIIAAGLVALGI